MKIIKFQKCKNNQYKIIMDNTLEMKLYDDVIVKYNLLAHKDMDEKRFQEVTKYNDSLDGYYKAIKYISTKMRSKREIENYLTKQNFSKEIVESTVTRLEKDGYINSKVYLEAYINDAINLTKKGPYAIKKDLEKLGFREEEVIPYLDKVSHDIWIERIQNIITKKIKLNHTAGSRKLKDKITYDLNNLGYDKEDVKDVLESITLEEDMDLLQKEAEKLKVKLSKKYADEKINYMLRQKLYAKGFSIDAINTILNDN